MSDVAPDDFPHDQVAPQVGAATTLGQKLAAERHARNWTIEYVAGQLNLAVRQIQALEADNYAALPGIASVRGFVRAYAKLLRVEADPLVSLIVSEQIVPNQPLEPKPNLSSTPFSHSRLSGGTNHSNSIKGIALALIVVLLAVAAIGIEHMGGWPTLSQSLSAQFRDLTGSGSSSSSQPSTETPASDAGKPANDADSTKDSSASDTREPVKETVTAPETQAPAQTEPAQASVPASVPEPAPVAPAPVPAQSSQPAATPKASSEPASASKPAAASGAGTLILTARQNSWIDVRAGSNVIASHLLKAGDTENIEVPGAATLTIGNAAGVSATFRGQAVSTGGDGKSNVAHISLK